MLDQQEKSNVNDASYIQLYKVVCECIDSEGKIEKEHFIEIIKGEFEVRVIKKEQIVFCVKNEDAHKCDV